MRPVMPQPVLIGSTYYLRVHVPRDVATEARGTTIGLPIGDRLKQVRITSHAKTSLRTKNYGEARRRFATALAALEAYWEQLRNGPHKLTYKDAVALGGEVRSDFIRIFDEEPDSPELWQHVEAMDNEAREGRARELEVTSSETERRDVERRFGPLADVVLARRGITVDSASRSRVVQQVAEAMRDVPRVNHAKSLGDYSESGQTDRFPAFRESEPTGEKHQRSGNDPTFSSVIYQEVENRRLGQEAKPLPTRSLAKYEKAASDFAAFRKNDNVASVTAQEADGWKRDMLSSREMSNNTVKQRLQNIKTVIEWARKQSLGDLFPNGNPLAVVTLPQQKGAASDATTLQPDEAKFILRASRCQTDADRRWLPWLCAYSGARINEVAQLSTGCFFQHEGRWYYELTTKGGRSLKNEHSIRRVPVHPDLVSEGLIDFVREQGLSEDRSMFSGNAAEKVRRWVRRGLELDRPEMAPNHGWRHLFEDLAMAAGVSDSAKSYITGRSSGHSSEGYGKSNVMLPGLAREMDKIEPFSV